jgi:hypothetical protein
LITALETNPKQYPKKQGKLKEARAADLKLGNISYRAVFTLDEAARIVSVLSCDAHDDAYWLATKRIKRRRRS